MKYNGVWQFINGNVIQLAGISDKMAAKWRRYQRRHQLA